MKNEINKNKALSQTSVSSRTGGKKRLKGEFKPKKEFYIE